MLKIRLRRVGAKKQPSYRIVVAEATAPRDGRFLEIIGHYNPRTEPETVSVNAGRAAYWISVGAQPTRAVERLLRKGGAYDASVTTAPAAVETAPSAPIASETPVTPEAPAVTPEASAAPATTPSEG